MYLEKSQIFMVILLYYKNFDIPIVYYLSCLLFFLYDYVAGVAEIDNQADCSPVQKQSYRTPAKADE